MSRERPVDRRALLTAMIGAAAAPLTAMSATPVTRRKSIPRVRSELPCVLADDTLRNVGVKFAADGAPMRFAGNTIICHIPMNTSASRTLIGVRDELAQPRWRRAFAFLPPESYHMTFFDGASPRIQEHGIWFEGLPLDLDPDAINVYVERRLRSTHLELEAPIGMKLDHFRVEDTVKAILTPITTAANVKLRAARELLSQKLRLRRPDHETYQFHVTLAYKVGALEQRDLQALKKKVEQATLRHRAALSHIELGRPEYCTYRDMLSYDTRFLL